MKNLLVLFAMLVFAGQAHAFAGTHESQSGQKYVTTLFDVNLNCGKCQAKIEKNIPFERGVKDVVVNLSNKTVAVTYDPSKNSSEKLQESLVKLGFKVTPAESSAGK